MASFKLCIDKDGAISRLKFLKSSGIAGYDDKIEHEMSTWRYSPFIIDGKATPVCTAVTLVYSQRSADPVDPPPTP